MSGVTRFCWISQPMPQYLILVKLTEATKLKTINILSVKLQWGVAISFVGEAKIEIYVNIY